ncbi:MAG: tyrosine--tRNA ligase [Chitinispirillia bacterium]|jgi:tyrosyl-tRNA synthetase
MDFFEELKWRGLIHNFTPGLQERLAQGSVAGYIGFDPTAASLQVGNLAVIMLLVHFQRAGHFPIALIGGATGMIGDPSEKSEERVLLSIEEIKHNQDCFKKQLNHFLQFDKVHNPAEIVNNIEWLGDVSFLNFLRDAGKHLTVSYMIAKDSVQQRLESGLSFTEFSYQLLQGYDFFWLNKNKNCLVQMGGSDQWGNITAGIELIRRKSGNEAHAITCPLLIKSDGSKFGKSEAGEKIWLDPAMTSPYKFYQFWLNCTDEEAKRYIRIFSLLSQTEIKGLEQEMANNPDKRPIQRVLAREITTRVHSENDYKNAVDASEILFGKGTTEMLQKISERNFLEIFNGVPRYKIEKQIFEFDPNVISVLSDHTKIFFSKGEARRMIQNQGLSINKIKINNQKEMITSDYFLNGKYILVQKGKKNYSIIEII